MRDVAVVGVAMHPFGKFEDRTAAQMCQQVAEGALRDAGLDWKRVQAISAGSSRFSGGLARGLAGNDVAAAMGLTGIPVYNLSAACATGGGAFSVAYSLIASGLYDVVLAIAGEKMPKGFIARPAGAAEDASDIDFVRWAYVGIPNPGYWALECRRRMEDYGTTEKQLAQVTVKARRIGEHNPNARYRQAITIEEVINSPLVSSPLRLYEICAVSDGAAAAILCSADVARQCSTNPLWIAATTVATAQFGDPAIRIPEVSTIGVTPGTPAGAYVSEATGAVKNAFEASGMSPSDIDFIELTDNSVWQELAYPEIWGFCEPGQGDWMVEHGETGPDGKLPINPSGGFLSFGEATNAMGIFQVVEMAYQLRGQAGQRQVPDASVGLAQTLGLGGNGSAIILKR